MKSSVLLNTKKSFSSRLNANDSDGEHLYIQMVTALVFQLIQCVVRFPSERETEDDCNKKVTTNYLTDNCFIINCFNRTKCFDSDIVLHIELFF